MGVGMGRKLRKIIRGTRVNGGGGGGGGIGKYEGYKSEWGG